MLLHATTFLSLLCPLLAILEESHCGRSDWEPGTVYTHSVFWSEEGLAPVRRVFHVYLPEGYEATKEHPVVVHYHGWGEQAMDYHLYYHWKTVADDHGVIMVYPEGMDDCAADAQCQMAQWGKYKSWNAAGSTQSTDRRMSCDPRVQTMNYCYKSCQAKKGDCHPCDWTTCYDDVSFTKQMIKHIRRTMCVDQERIFAAGCSNGGQLVHELARDMPDEIAGIAAMCGGKPHQGWAYMPPSGPPMPVILITGRSDPTMPRNQPLKSDKRFDGFLFADEDTVMRMYRHYNQCTNREPADMPTDFKRHNRRCRLQGYNCSDGAEVVECAWDGGHDVRRSDSRLVMEFFLSHHRGARAALQAKHGRKDLKGKFVHVKVALRTDVTTTTEPVPSTDMSSTDTTTTGSDTTTYPYPRFPLARRKAKRRGWFT